MFPISATFLTAALASAPATLITRDGKITKQKIREAFTSRMPQPDDVVPIHYVGQVVNGSVFDSSRTRGQPITFTVGHGVIQGWSIGIQTMNVGECATFVID
jgi:FKBP-type peptidyl-prolyl cis-trans isomerase